MRTLRWSREGDMAEGKGWRASLILSRGTHVSLPEKRLLKRDHTLSWWKKEWINIKE